MLAQHFDSMPIHAEENPAVMSRDVTMTYGALATRGNILTERWRALAGLRVCLAVREPENHIAAAIALDRLQCRTVLAGDRSLAEIRALADQLHWQAVVWNVIDEPELLNQVRVDETAAAGAVTLLTSGTTGRPKAANHTWATLAGPVRRDFQYQHARWLCAYPLSLYAGTQVVLQAVLNWSALVIPSSLEPVPVARTMRLAGVTHASGTPTFWRRLLLFASPDDLRACRLEQITMGGEAVTQPLLDHLSDRFPETRLVHIYASTELGRLFSVTDRQEGFPAMWLDEPQERGIALRVLHGELMARSRHAMVSYDQPGLTAPATSTNGEAEGWTATGDLVERRGDRVVFRGRKSDLINVGGRKVLPLTVEAVLREAAGVRDVRVYGKGSSLVGQVVAADVVLADGSEEGLVRAAIDRIARDRLARHEVPRLVQIVESIAHTRAFKVVRSEVG